MGIIQSLRKGEGRKSLAGARYLADDDIADTVRQAAQAASKSPPDAPATGGRVVPMPVPGPSRQSKKQRTTEDATPIDFPSASQRLQEGRMVRAAVTAWRNFSLAVDEALDVYVARQVATKLAWNRITRALGQAMDARRAEIEVAERKAPPLEYAEALLAAVDAVNLDDDEEPFDEETPDEQVHTPLFPGLWRSHDARRWQPREEPFKGFESPPGKF
jgi:hypothetical protein